MSGGELISIVLMVIISSVKASNVSTSNDMLNLLNSTPSTTNQSWVRILNTTAQHNTPEGIELHNSIGVIALIIIGVLTIASGVYVICYLCVKKGACFK